MVDGRVNQTLVPPQGLEADVTASFSKQSIALEFWFDVICFSQQSKLRGECLFYPEIRGYSLWLASIPRFVRVLNTV